MQQLGFPLALLFLSVLSAVRFPGSEDYIKYVHMKFCCVNLVWMDAAQVGGDTEIENRSRSSIIKSDRRKKNCKYLQYHFSLHVPYSRYQFKLVYLSSPQCGSSTQETR